MLASDNDALDTLDRAERNVDDRKTLWRCLSVYDMSDDYEAFCQWLHLDSTHPDVERLYEIVHQAYAEAWKRYGWTQLQMMIRIGWQGLYSNRWMIA